MAQNDPSGVIAPVIENFAVLRHITLNLLERHPAKLSLKPKRFKATLDDYFTLRSFTQLPWLALIPGPSPSGRRVSRSVLRPSP